MHYTNELIFERPPGLVDRTAHVLAAGEGGPTPFTIVISKSSLDPFDTLATMVDRIEAELSRSLEAFRLTARKDDVVAGQPAVLLQFQWVQNGVQLFQKQAAFIAPLAEGPTLMQVAATATAEAAPDHAAGFSAMLASLRLRSPAAA